MYGVYFIFIIIFHFNAISLYIIKFIRIFFKSSEIGWFLYSTKEMDAGALVVEIEDLVGIKVGLRWKIIDVGIGLGINWVVSWLN
jgi:hypothetical protein